jgi:bifunctional DNase/RNase
MTLVAGVLERAPDIFIQTRKHASRLDGKLSSIFGGAAGRVRRGTSGFETRIGLSLQPVRRQQFAFSLSSSLPVRWHRAGLFFLNGRDTVLQMNKTVIEVQVRAVLPTSGGCAVFLGNSDKVFIIYVDQTVGSAITMFMRDISKERPLTHDLIAHLMTALGAHVERVIINDLKNATYYARMIIRAENELQQKKIIELDGRPSDCIAMATQQKAPIYVSQEVWDEVDDMSDVLRKMEEEGLKPDPEAESTEEE